MYRFGDFTSRANTAINLAIKISGELGHTYVGSEHLLWGLCGEGSGVAYCALQARHVSAGQLSELLVRTIGRGSPVSLTPDDLTPRSRRILERAAQQARKNRLRAGWHRTYPGFHPGGAGELCGAFPGGDRGQ